MGGAGGACAPPSFGISVNPIRTKGGRLCPLYYYWPPHLYGQCGVSVTTVQLRKLYLSYVHSLEIKVFIFYFAELTNDFSWYEKETIIRWLSWTPTEPIRLNNLGTNYTMKTQYKQEEGFPSGFFPFLLDFRCLVTSIFSLSLSCFGSAVDLEKVLEFIATIWI